MRTTLYQASLALLTRSKRWSTLKAWGMAVAKRRGLRRAIVAVERKLAIVMHRHRQSYDEADARGAARYDRKVQQEEHYRTDDGKHLACQVEPL